MLPALLLPFLSHPGTTFELTNGQLYLYHHLFGRAAYTKDADSRPRKIDILSGGRVDSRRQR